MLDMKFIRENAELVKENCRKKFQDHKVAMVDELIELDAQYRGCKTKADNLRAQRNALSKQIGVLMGQKKKEEAEEVKVQVKALGDEMAAIEKLEDELQVKVKQIQMIIPNIIDPTVPIGKDDSENVELQKYGEPALKPFDIPYQAPEIISFIITLLKTSVPIILIFVSLVSLLKSLGAPNEDEIKKAQKSFVRKVTASILAFLVITIVQFVIRKVADSSDSASVSTCLSCFMNNDCDGAAYYKTNVGGTYLCTKLDGSGTTFECKGNK